MNRYVGENEKKKYHLIEVTKNKFLG